MPDHRLHEKSYAEIARLIADIETERDTWKAQSAHNGLPDLTAMHLDMVELERTADRLRAAAEQSERGRLYLVEKVKDLEAEIARLMSQLDNVRADRQAQDAALRDGYRLKTGEVHRG